MNDRELRPVTQAITANTQAVTSLHAWLLENARAISKRDLKDMEDRLVKAITPGLTADDGKLLNKLQAQTQRRLKRMEDLNAMTP